MDGTPFDQFTTPGSEERVSEFVKLLRDDLAFLLDERDVELQVQAAISYLNYRSINRFAFIGRNVESVMEFCRDDLGLPRNAAGRAMTSAVCDAWEAAQKRKRARDDQEAEAATGKLSRTSLDGDHVLLRKALFKRFFNDFPLENEEVPAGSYIDTRLIEVERGELLAESLEYVLSVEDSGEGGPDVEWVSEPNHFTGKATIRKVAKKVPLPENTEDLRRVYKLMALHWVMVALKQPSRAYLNGVHPGSLDPHLAWLMGKDVLKLQCKVNGLVVAMAPWDLFLSFELELRKWAGAE